MVCNVFIIQFGLSGLGFVMYGRMVERLVECVHMLIQITVVIAILDPSLTLLPTPSSSSIQLWVQRRHNGETR